MLIKNVRIVDETQDRMGSVLINDGRIATIFEDIQPAIDDAEGVKVYDGGGRTLMPSFIDMHAHMREPGYEYKEDLESGLSAALAGGYTHVCAMANTLPITDTGEKIRQLVEKAQALDLAHLIQVCAVTEDFVDDPDRLVDFQTARPWTPIFSNDGKNMAQQVAVEKALRASKKYDFILSCHCEPETDMVEFYIEQAKRTGGNLHICHISTKATLEAIRQAKAEGVGITCEVTPHHLFAWDLAYIVAPPIAGKADVEALIEGIREGVIDVLATDHAPHTPEDKEKGMPGISNLDVAFSIYHTVFQRHHLSLQRLSRMLSAEPARLLRLATGRINVGREANLVLVDLEEDVTIDPSTFRSKGENTPFGGQTLKGRIVTTIKGGIVKYDHGQIIR
jgi:dihydroorotase